MSETDLKADRDAFFNENGYGKLLKEHLKVYIYSEGKCTTLGGILRCKNNRIYFIFQLNLLFNIKNFSSPSILKKAPIKINGYEIILMSI